MKIQSSILLIKGEAVKINPSTKAMVVNGDGLGPELRKEKLLNEKLSNTTLQAKTQTKRKHQDTMDAMFEIAINRGGNFVSLLSYENFENGKTFCWALAIRSKLLQRKFFENIRALNPMLCANNNHPHSESTQPVPPF